MARDPANLTISQVAQRTGIPASTLRFYERELVGLFHIRKTPGGHRRYADSDVRRFFAVRRLTETEGLGLAEVRRILMSRGEHDAVREEVDRLAEAHASDTEMLQSLARRIAELEGRIAALEAARAPRRRWLTRRER